jgi:hypothetical protein
LYINAESCACFIDWQKEFDRVNRTKLVQILKETGFDLHEIKLVSRLYIDQNVRMRLDQWETRSVNIGRGIRQGWSLSPIIFNLCSENLTKGALEGSGDFRIEGQRIYTARYAYDLVLLANEGTMLQDVIERLIEIERCCQMGMNVGEKNKVMKDIRKTHAQYRL